MRIGQRLAMGFGVLVMVVLVSAAVTIAGLERLSETTRTLYEHPFTVSSSALQAQLDISRIRNEMLRLLVFGKPDEIEATSAEVERLSASVDSNLAVVHQWFLGDVRRVEKAQAAMAEWGPIRHRIVETLRQGRREDAERIARTEGSPAFDRAMEEMNYVVGFARNKGDTLFREVLSYAHRFTVVAVSIFLLGFILAALVSLRVTASITQPLESLLAAKRQLTEGNLRVEIPGTDREDEVGAMARHLEVLKIRMQERAHMQESTRLLSEALEQSSNLVMVADRFGSIVHVNRAFTEVTGFLPEDVLGANPRILQSGHTAPETYEDLWSTISAGKVWHGEMEDRRKDGSAFWSLATISPIRDAGGAITHYIASYQDITERKLAEVELRHARDQAEIANRAKSELLANMSHELRTPLNAIIGFAEVIATEALGPNHPSYGEYMADIISSGRHLLALINDILDVSALEAGKMTLHEEAVEVAGLAASAARLVTPKVHDNGLTLEIHLAPGFTTIRGDERRLKQILLNLLSNATKFTPRGGTITLSADRNGDGEGFFAVADTGIGMDADGIRRALSPFGQVENAYARTRDGSGLGLPLSAGLAEAHGGRLDLASSPGGGTTVTVTFPPERCLD